MSNSFPSVPADLVLASVTYTASLGSEAATSSATKLTFAGARTYFGGGLGDMASGGSTITFEFTTPGSFGSFDQTTAENVIATLVTDTCQIYADLTGATLAEIQAAATITRQWNWADAAQNNAVYVDTMTYPPAAS